ncbi:hypothetical protein DFH07DRAFT_946832 [Mycena maculata]|uniref:Uncharacterized protein n=1 Tax=Mycena maculata TaxID=230809 RepID=A0AAD7HJ33_9AGAR|nr:hypothetical protein DFH07DRAFT_946832 [Mycena maculata]
MYIRRRPPNPHIVHHPRVAPAHRSCLVGVVSGRSMTGSKGDELGVSRGSDALRKPIYGHGKECVNTGEEVRPETEKGKTRWAREDASSRWASGGCENISAASPWVWRTNTLIKNTTPFIFLLPAFEEKANRIILFNLQSSTVVLRMLQVQCDEEWRKTLLFGHNEERCRRRAP